MGILSMVNQFKHRGEVRESKDEIMIGEVVYLLSQQGWPTIGFRADGDLQHIRFRAAKDPTLYSLHVRLDRKTGTGAISSALVGSKATLYIKGEVKNLLADPDDLIKQWSTDVKNILKVPLLGQVKLNHELNSVFAEKGVVIDIDTYVLKGEDGRAKLQKLLVDTINELREKLQPYKKA